MVTSNQGNNQFNKESLHTLNVQSVFSNINNGQPAMEKPEALRFLNFLQTHLNLQPKLSSEELQSIFQSLQRDGTMTYPSFSQAFQPWLMKRVEAMDKEEVLQPVPTTAFYSHQINKTYEIQLSVEEVRYLKIKFRNPDEVEKTLVVTSENETVMQVRRKEIHLIPRTGVDYIRLKFTGRNKPGTVETRLALERTDPKEVEEVLLFRVLTTETPPKYAEVISPVAQVVNPKAE